MRWKEVASQSSILEMTSKLVLGEQIYSARTLQRCCERMTGMIWCRGRYTTERRSISLSILCVVAGSRVVAAVAMAACGRATSAKNRDQPSCFLQVLSSSHFRSKSVAQEGYRYLESLEC